MDVNTKIREFAADRGIELSDHDVKLFLRARQILSDTSQSAYHCYAQKIIDLYSNWFSHGGPKPSTFAEFFLPFPEEE
jgi:hypothetical protein